MSAERLYDNPSFTIDALEEVQREIVRFSDRYCETWERGGKPVFNWSLVEMARDWDGLDLASVVPVLREAAHMIRLLNGHEDENG